jgi:hypothetical protein
MQSLSIDKAFFELVNNNEQWTLTICHRVRLVAEVHEDLLGLLSVFAPVCQNSFNMSTFDAECAKSGLF